MPVYQVCYDNINTYEIKKELFSLVKREIKEDTQLTDADPICHAQASVWFISLPKSTTSIYLSSVFSEEDIIITVIQSRASIIANKKEVKSWLDVHLK